MQWNMETTIVIIDLSAGLMKKGRSKPINSCLHQR